MGKLIVLSGGDGSGKTVQSRLLKEKIVETGKTVTNFDFPRYDALFGKLIRRYLNGELGGEAVKVSPYLAALPYALDRFAAREGLLLALSRGYVLSNRYTPDNLAHQAAKVDHSQWLGLASFIEEVEYEILGLPRPELVIYLKVDPYIAARLTADRIKDQHEADLEYQKRVMAVFEWLARKQAGWRVIECVDNGWIGEPEVIHQKVWEAANKIC